MKDFVLYYKLQLIVKELFGNKDYSRIFGCFYFDKKEELPALIQLIAVCQLRLEQADYDMDNFFETWHVKQQIIVA